MSRKEVSDLLEKIQVYRQSFLITTNVINEWCRILEPYDSADVNKKLDEYLQNGDNFGKYPDVYYLTKFLKTKEEKLNQNQVYAICPFCKSKVSPEDYQSHYHKCSSIQYLIDVSKKYFCKDLSKTKLRQMSNEDFEKFYWKVCNLLNEKIQDGNLKHSLENAILTHNGLTPKYDLEGLIDDN